MVVSKAVYHELFQSALSEGLKQPGESEFEQRPFTRLAEYLDGVEEALRRAGFQALITFDEYERMEEGIESAKITRDMFNTKGQRVKEEENKKPLIPFDPLTL